MMPRRGLALLLVMLAAGGARAEPSPGDDELYGDSPAPTPAPTPGPTPRPGKPGAQASDELLYGDAPRSRLLELRLVDFPTPLFAVDPHLRLALGVELRVLPGLGDRPPTSETVLALDLPGLSLRLPATRTGSGDFYVGDTRLALGVPVFAGRRAGRDWHLTPAATVLLGDELGPYADDNAWGAQLAGGLQSGGVSLQLIPRLHRFPVRRFAQPTEADATAVLGGELVLAGRAPVRGHLVSVLIEAAAAVPLGGPLAGEAALELGAGVRAQLSRSLTLGLAAASRVGQVSGADRIIYGVGPLDRGARLQVTLGLTMVVGGLDGKLDRK